jgi:hypothetical protein
MRARKPDSEADATAAVATHLTDTITVRGNFILFLRPDQQRFDSYNEDEHPGLYEADSDFGFGIDNTLNALAKNRQFKGIQGLVSTERYVLIRDCATCPLVIDRDTIDYGVILSAKDEQIETTYESVHGGDYLEEVKAYFKIK